MGTELTGETYVLRNIANSRQHAQDIEEAIVVILPCEGPAGVAFGELGEDFGGDEGWIEEGG
jgi:hypothetical protein